MIMIKCLLFCCTTIMTNTPWTEADEDVLSQARNRCKEIYKESPCLVKLTKKEEQLFQAVCGKDNNE